MADGTTKRSTAGGTPLARYRSGLVALRRGRRFIDWSERRKFHARIASLLEDLRSSGCDAKSDWRHTLPYVWVVQPTCG